MLAKSLSVAAGNRVGLIIVAGLMLASSSAMVINNKLMALECS